MKQNLAELSEQRHIPWSVLFPNYQERLAAMAMLVSDIANRPHKLTLVPIMKDHYEAR
jgi:hypothetical protein